MRKLITPFQDEKGTTEAAIPEQPLDVLIIGSGLGGLVCGAILGMEGYKVCILEKNRQVGGCLQTFSRDKVIFDSGVHYLGGLEKGQNLYQIFQYLGIMDKLRIKKMDEDAFDKIIFPGDPKEYRIAQGHENFVKQLVKDFPEEEHAIIAFSNKMQEICDKFPLYNLRAGTNDEKTEVLSLNAKSYIESVTSNKRLQEVLAGDNILYAGTAEQAPMYVHSLVLNSFIQSSWKCIDGGSQIGKYLVKVIREHGGDIIKHCEVKELVEENDVLTHVVLADGRKMYAKNFISNLHPAKTMEMTRSQHIRQAYRKRIAGLENTVSSFTVHIVLKKNSYKYMNCNYYYLAEDGVWNAMNYDEESWPKNYGVFIAPTSKSEEWADGLTLLTYMRFDDVKPWAHTFNTTMVQNDRGETYEMFKKRKAEKLIDLAEERFPGLKAAIKTYYCSTPLSYRDYIGSDDGSMYGILKDNRDPFRNLISARTRVPNLFLTGQNLVLHGILGVSISALSTCACFVDIQGLLEKIRNA